jgi:hypothetical protein
LTSVYVLHILKHHFFLYIYRDFLSDCLEGQIITAFVIIIFVAAYLFREWVMQNLPAEQPIAAAPAAPVPPAPLNEDHDHFIQEQVAVDTLMNAMQVLNNNHQDDEDDSEDENRHHMQRQLNHLRVELENEVAARTLNTTDQAWSSSLHERVMDQDEDQLFGGIGSSQHQQFHRHHHHHDEEDDPWMDEEEEESLPDLIDQEQRNINNEAIRQMIRQHLGQDADFNLDFPVPPAIDRNPEDPFLAGFEREMMAQRAEAREAMREPMAAAAAVAARGGDAAEGMAAALAAMDQEEEPLEVGDDINGVLEAIGMRGNPWMLVQNSVLMSLMISLCLAIAVWIPYVVGRLVILVGGLGLGGMYFHKKKKCIY